MDSGVGQSGIPKVLQSTPRCAIDSEETRNDPDRSDFKLEMVLFLPRLPIAKGNFHPGNL